MRRVVGATGLAPGVKTCHLIVSVFSWGYRMYVSRIELVFVLHVRSGVLGISTLSVCVESIKMQSVIWPESRVANNVPALHSTSYLNPCNELLLFPCEPLLFFKG